MNDNVAKRVCHIVLNIIGNAPQPTHNYFTIYLTKEEAEYLKSLFIGKINDDYYEGPDKNFYKIYITDK